MKLNGFIISAMALAVSACSNGDKWSVSGTVEGGDGELMTLERSLFGVWTVLDSVRLDSDGEYRFEHEPAGYPDIYRLRINGRTAYFPIDSIEDVTLSGDAATFSSSYTLDGSSEARMLADINNKINVAIAQKGTSAVNDSILKRELSGIILGDMSSIVSYYIINKEISGQRIFNPANKGDLRVIGAVVNAFNSFRPDDPRTRFLEQQYLNWRREAGVNASTAVEAIEIGFPDIVLCDANGQERALSDLAGRGRPVIVNFTAYAAENSPAINVALAEVYNAGGVDIYQISIDADEYLWREAARNLPWTAVHNSPRDGQKALVDYNVGAIPQTFIIDAAGQLQERVSDLSTLKTAIRKYK